MKVTLALLIALGVSNIFALSIVPDRVVTPLLDVFNGRNKIEGDSMRVMVTTYDSSGRLKKNGSSTLIGKTRFENIKGLSIAVFRAQLRTSAGTAFHIGRNLVLTNLHVLSPDMNERSGCGSFELKQNDGDDEFDCKKVHFCNKALDVCLIEMAPIKKTIRSCFFCRGRKEYIHMSPALKLRHHSRTGFSESDTEVFSAIGNSSALGIHYSEGRGLRDFGGSDLYFFAPIRPGNSGGPLLNENGEVVGIVKAETMLTVSDDYRRTFNFATKSEHTILRIRLALDNDPETLEKFNEAVIE
jgi:hypothetical protein